MFFLFGYIIIYLMANGPDQKEIKPTCVILAYFYLVYETLKQAFAVVEVDDS